MLSTFIGTLCLVSSLSILDDPSKPRQLDFSFNGYTGAMNTPSARILKSGQAIFQYNDYENLEYGANVADQQNVIFLLGFLPWFEAGYRATDVRADISKTSAINYRDLSFNFKAQILRENESFLPNLSLMAIDPGGLKNLFRNFNFVVGKTLFKWVEVNAGWGFSSDSAVFRRLDGPFGNVILNAHNLAHLLYEYDDRSHNFGANVYPLDILHQVFKLKSIKKLPVDIVMAYGLIDGDRHHFGISLALDLWPSRRPDQGAYVQSDLETRKSLFTASQKKALEEKLTDEGFENVSVYDEDNKTLIALENRIYLRNPKDIQKPIEEYIKDLKLPLKSYSLVYKKRDLPVYQRDFIKQKNEFVEGAGSYKKASFNGFYKGKNPSFLKSDLELTPRMFHKYATETGMIRMSWRIQPSLITPLWPGAVTNFMLDIPLYHDSDFQSRGYSPRLERALFQQFLALPVSFPAYSQISLGRFDYDREGGLLEIYIPWASYPFGFLGNGGFWWMDQNFDKRKLYGLAGVSGHLPVYDLRAKIMGGRYVDKDYGGGIDLTRFFGNIELGFFFRSTTRAVLAGALIRIPLTSRRELFDPNWVRIKTPELYRFRHSTTLKAWNVAGNPILSNVGEQFETTQELDDVILNRQRPF